MDRAIAGLLGGLLAIALAIVAIVYIGTFVVTVGAGLFGLVCVKTKRPIVPPNGFVLVPLAYAIIWAAAITLALLLGGSLLNEVRGLKHGNPFVAWGKDALLFFLEGTVVLFAAARLSKSRIAGVNPAHASAVVSSLAAISFSISSAFLADNNLPDAIATIAGDIFRTISWPIVGPISLARDFSSEASRLWRWLLTADGNMFKLSGVIAAVVWLYALIQFVLGFSKTGSDQPEKPPRDDLEATETLMFLATMASAGLVAGIVWLSWYEDQHGFRFSFWLFNPFFTFFLAYILLWVVLWLSRHRARFD